jgi:hypothetical protein
MCFNAYWPVTTYIKQSIFYYCVLQHITAKFAEYKILISSLKSIQIKIDNFLIGKNVEIDARLTTFKLNYLILHYHVQ